MLRPLKPSDISYIINIFKETTNDDPTLFHVSSYLYTDIRKFGRNVIDNNVSLELMKAGCVGSIYGVSIYVVKHILVSVIGIFSESHSKHFNIDDDIFHHDDYRSCTDNLCIVGTVIVS